jgi:hypothetical protein
MAEKMTSRDYSELARLSQKAAWDERENQDNRGNYDILMNVSAFAGRRA